MHADYGVAMRADEDVATAAARIAAQLAREPSALRLSADEIARDAATVYALAVAMRDALAASDRARYQRALRALRARAARYQAKVVANGDAAGMVAGLELASGTHRSGHRDWFYLA
jgi:hypothetical protein